MTDPCLPGPVELAAWISWFASAEAVQTEEDPVGIFLDGNMEQYGIRLRVSATGFRINASQFRNPLSVLILGSVA